MNINENYTWVYCKFEKKKSKCGDRKQFEMIPSE